MPLPSNSASAPERRATTATIDTGTAVASGVVLATTAGTGSLDRYACELAARLDVRAVEIDGYVRTGDLFGVPLLSRRSLQFLAADLDHVRLLRGASGRLVHFPHHHLARYGRFLSRPYVVTVHDLIRFFDLKRLDVFIHRPNLRDRLLLRLDYAGVAGATALIAVSETTKRDVVRHLGVPEERIFVVHEGIDHARFRPVERRLLNERYVLFVGSEHPRKNLAAVLRAFAALKRERRLSDLKLVKVGGPGGSEAPFRAGTLALVRALGLDDDVVFTEHVPDEDLSAWYSGAACLAWPSLYEGFGFPPLEAMACGCPVVVSTAGSLPEIAGPAALLVEPRDERALADAIRTLILDPPSDLIERGLAHAARFSWDRTARETLCVYETLLERGSCLDPDPPPDRSPSLYRMRSARPSGFASCGRNSPTRASESPASVFGEASTGRHPIEVSDLNRDGNLRTSVGHSMVVSRLRFLLGRPQSADTPARATHAFDRAEDARGHHGGPVLGASTLGELALSPALHDEAWAIVDRLEPDDNVSHVRDFVAEGRRLAGREWRYVDIASALAAATELLRPSSYLEVGVRRGRSMAIVAARAPKCSIIGVDMWQPNYAGMENPGPEHVRAELAKVGFAGDLEFLTGDSHRVLPRLFSQRPDLTFDLITVDGDHSPRGAARDLRDVLHRLRIGGVLVFDDISHPHHPKLLEIWRRVVVAERRYSTWHFDDVGYGVAVAVRRW